MKTALLIDDWKLTANQIFDLAGGYESENPSSFVERFFHTASFISSNEDAEDVLHYAEILVKDYDNAQEGDWENFDSKDARVITNLARKLILKLKQP